ncbi:hypothetical protein [Pseudomonas sp. CGJS7]|uniref:hypothetical protein n=1 Tax=Pseudomonas sp. CGJS7 TaxID=3109348 RepID=UPI00300A52E6
MWRILVFATALAGFSPVALLHAAPNEPTPETRRQEAKKYQQDRLQAITRRGRFGDYQQLLTTGKVRTASALPADRADALSRDAAIDAAALGITAAEVNAFRRRNIDLVGMAHRLFTGITTPAEQMLLADLVVVATAGKVRADRNRIDGFLSEMPFTIVKSLKGSRTAGDVVFVARSSGPQPNGNEIRDFGDVDFEPGKKYLLVLSKNWYEQFVALSKKQPESSFTALPFLAYEVLDGGKLRRGPQPTISGEAPKDLASAESDLGKLTGVNNKAGGRR